jgi:ABC-type antimicrobial peptide transport system permease subunit
MRSALTLMGVTLGSALLVALGTIAGAADSRIIGRLNHGGPAAAIKVAAAAPQGSQLENDGFKVGKPRDITEATVTQIRGAPHVAAVVPVLSSHVFAVPPAGDDFFATMVGADMGSPDLPVTVLAGRLPQPGSLTEIAVGLGYLDRFHLNPNRPSAVLGQEMEIAAPQVRSGSPLRYQSRWFKAEIVGVVAQQLADGEFLVPIEQARVARAWALGGIGDGSNFPLPGSEYSGLLVIANGLSEVHAVRAEITLIGYATSAPEHLVASVQKYLGIVDIVLGSIGSIALVVAALDIANALFAAVRERRREIGVLKAIGARDRDILRWFLLEALIIGAAGGLLGSLAGAALTELVGAAVNRYLVQQGLPGVDLGGVPAWILLAGVAGTGLLAMLAGAIPAWQAARLPAREAVGAL